MAYEYLNNIFYGNTILNYIQATIIFFGILIGLKLFKTIILNRVRKFARKTHTHWDDFIIAAFDSVNSLFFIIVSLFISIMYIEVHPVLSKSIEILFDFGVVFYIVRSINKGIKKISEKMIEKEKEDSASIELFTKLIRGSLWIVAFLVVISNLGYDISTLITGLGISGIAVAFALQNILSDIFASFSIHFDKPFKIGDFIVIGADMGTVKKIGIKSTRITTLQGQELIVSNKELTNIRINNFKKMQQRRIAFQIGVTYQTPKSKLEQIPKWINEIIKQAELANPSRTHLNKFDDSSLTYDIVYYMKVSDYDKYMDTQQEINLAIIEKFKEEDVEFAYPTQTLFIEK